MLPELALLSVLGCAGGGAYYLYRDHVRSRKAAIEREEAERKTMASAFRAALVRELRGSRPSEFRFGEFVRKCDVPRADADRVAEELFLGLARKVVADGV